MLNDECAAGIVLGVSGKRRLRMQVINDGRVEEITPEMLANVFAAMGSDEQARFFNRISEVASTWGGGFPMQLQWITDDDGLTLGGRHVMQCIGEYSHWGLVPRWKEDK